MQEFNIGYALEKRRQSMKIVKCLPFLFACGHSIFNVCIRL